MSELWRTDTQPDDASGITHGHRRPARAAADGTDEFESALETARRQRTSAANRFAPTIVKRSTYPTKVQEVTVPIERDDGTVEVFTGIGPTR